MKMTVEFHGKDVEQCGSITIEGVTVEYHDTGDLKDRFAVYKGEGSPSELYLICPTKEEAKRYVEEYLCKQDVDDSDAG